MSSHGDRQVNVIINANNRSNVKNINVPSPIKGNVYTSGKVAKLATFAKTRGVPRIEQQWIISRDCKQVIAIDPINLKLGR